MTREEAAFEIAKNACVAAAVFRFYSSSVEALDGHPEYRPRGYSESPLVTRAREMLQDWEHFVTAEALEEIKVRAKEMREGLKEANPTTYSRILKDTEST